MPSQNTDIIMRGAQRLHHTPHDAVDGNYYTPTTYPMDGRRIQHTPTMRLRHYDDSSMSVGNNKKQKMLTNLLRQHNNRNKMHDVK